MPIRYTIDAKRHLVHTTLVGDVGLAEILTYWETLRNDPAFEPSMHRLIDARDVTSILSVDEVRHLASVVRGQGPEQTGVRRAVVVAREVSFGLGRLFESYASGAPSESRVFRDESDAVAWLVSPSDSG